MAQDAIPGAAVKEAGSNWKHLFWLRTLQCSFVCLVIITIVPVLAQAVRYQGHTWEFLLTFYASQWSMCLVFYLVACTAAVIYQHRFLLNLFLIHVCIAILIGTAFI